MGSYEIIVKTEEIKRKVREEDYASALRILDTIDNKKIKNPSTLGLMAEVYTQNERYEEALQLLLRIYNKSKTRKVLNQLIWMSIQLCNIEEAESFLREYEKQAPRDYKNYIYRYQIDKLKGEAFAVLIQTLEKLKETEYIEQWAYELAKLYYKAGMEEECIRECSDIILWFGEGSYVEKARVLKAYYSGEADKDKIIEELKKRARQEYQRPEEENSHGSVEIAASLESEQKKEIQLTLPEDEADDFTNLMKRGVEEILSEDSTEKAPQSESRDEVYQIEYPYTGERLENSDTEADDTATGDLGKEDMEDDPIENGDINSGNNEDIPIKTGSTVDDNKENVGFDYERYGLQELSAIALTERELVEQEVEDELYRLLEEEDDEDSARLNGIHEETGIDVYEIFGNFLHVKSVRKQLVKSLDMILDKQTKSVQMIITGTPGSGKTALAKSIAIFLYRTGILRTSKIAKVSAEILNGADITAKKDALRDCCLVVEQASELKRPAIEKLLELIRLLPGEIGVIFEENKKNMNKLFRECPKLMDMFKNRIHLPQYNEEELLGFTYSYLRRKEYQLQKGAQTVLKNAVRQIIKKEAPEQQLETIQRLLQGAMDSADLRMGKRLSLLASQGRIGELGVSTLLPEDFNNPR